MKIGQSKSICDTCGINLNSKNIKHREGHIVKYLFRLFEYCVWERGECIKCSRSKPKAKSGGEE